MQLSIVIVSFNTKTLLKQTIRSISKKADWEMIVVDNSSSDGSIAMLKHDFPEVKVITNRANVGFAKANNQGIAMSTGESILLLNSDTIVYKDALENLLRHMENHPEVGIASGQLLNPDGSIQPQGGYLPGLLNIAFWMLFLDDLPLVGKHLLPYHVNEKAVFTRERMIGWVGGTAMMIRRAVIEKAGTLDEEIFMYAEDVEFCMRAQQEGFKVSITPEAKILHYGQQSSGGAPAAAWLGEYRGLMYIFRKHKPRWEYPVMKLLLKIGAILRMLLFGILQGRKDAYEAYKKAFAMA